MCLHIRKYFKLVGAPIQQWNGKVYEVISILCLEVYKQNLLEIQCTRFSIDRMIIY